MRIITVISLLCLFIIIFSACDKNDLQIINNYSNNIIETDLQITPDNENNENTIETDLFNLFNFGYMTSDSCYIYYINMEGDGGIYAYNFQNGKNILIPNVEAYNLVVFENKLYYINTTDNNRIYSSDTDGSNNGAVTDESVYFFVIYTGHIYYVPVSGDNHVSNGIYSISSNNDIIRLSDDSASYLYPYKDKIYYITTDNDGFSLLKSINLDGSGETIIDKNTVQMFFIHNDIIYYSKSIGAITTLYSMDLNGENSNTVLDKVHISTRNINILGDDIYFKEMLSFRQICGFNLNNRDFVTLGVYEDCNSSYYIVGDKIAYYNKENKLEFIELKSIGVNLED